MSQQPYFSTYIQDLEKDPFDPVDFVETLEWRIRDGKKQVDAKYLKNKFEEEIGSLQLLSDQFQSKINSYEQQLVNEKGKYLTSLQEAYGQNADLINKIKQLDSTMQTISTKVVHLGDQLQSVHAPRARAYEALELIHYFDEFLTEQPLNSLLFVDPDRLLESAEVIQKLLAIAQGLPREKFASVQARITHKYDEIEQLLIDEFFRSHDRRRMLEIANILSEFKGFSQCIDKFVEQVQNGSFRSGNVFDDIKALCERVKPLIEEIFPNSQQVALKLLKSVFSTHLQEAVISKLQDTAHPEVYLTNSYDLYSKTLRLKDFLHEKFKPDVNLQFLTSLVNSVFGSYLLNYPKREEYFISDHCTKMLRKFYESKGHQKKNFQSGGLQDLKRDIQARLLTVENYRGETFLSETIAINILQDVKSAFVRCSLFRKKPESLDLISSLFDLLLKFLYTDHVEYAVELGLAGIPLSEPKTEPPTTFFCIVQQSSTITHLFVKLFDDAILPIITETSIEDSILKKRDRTLRNLEDRLNLGLKRQVSSIVGFCRYMLSTEQKKSDFRPENDSRDITTMTKACSSVVRYLNSSIVDSIKNSVDGGNLQAVLRELGEILYSAILDHILSFNYNSSGAMLLLCDLSEYKKCINSWGIPELQKKFDSLHALSNLLVVAPQNLQQARSSQLLANVNHSLVNSFIQLRHDYKSAKIYLIE